MNDDRHKSAGPVMTMKKVSPAAIKKSKSEYKEATTSSALMEAIEKEKKNRDEMKKPQKKTADKLSVE